MEELVLLLKEKDLTISFAESITGGSLASLITKVSGASNIFKGSIVAYSNEVKEEVLKVSNNTIKTKSIVSSDVAKEMVLGLSKLIKSDIYISTTGNAGPALSKGTNKFNAFYAIKFKELLKVKEITFNNNDRLENISFLTKAIIKEIIDILKED